MYDSFQYKCSLDELSLRTLMVTIWNFDRFGRNIFLGEVPVIMSDVIEAGGLHQMNAEWYDLQEKVGICFNLSLFLAFIEAA